MKGRTQAILAHPHRLCLLGQFRLQRHDKTLERFRTRKAASLLAYLTLFPLRRHSREELTEMLWPDAAPEAARHNFRQALSTLRACLEPNPSERGVVLVSDHSYVALNERAVCTDVGEFETALRLAEQKTSADEQAAHLADADALYQGDLLPGFYDEWVMPERERLRAAHMRALEGLWQVEETRRNWPAALKCAQRAAQSDPHHEAAHAAMIRCYFETGQNARALDCYEDYARRLQQELDLLPSPALRSLVESGAQTPAAPPVERKPSARKSAKSAAEPMARPPLPASAPAVLRGITTPSFLSAPRLPVPLTAFFGRQAEMRRVRQALGRTRLLSLIGPGGCGKTRLAVETGRVIQAEFADRVYFVPLADVPHPSGIAPAVVDALCRAQAGSNAPPAFPDALERIAALLAPAPALLILDNYEHLAEDGAGFVAQLLPLCPLLTCLITSRRRLGVSGERAMILSPLSVPDPTSGLNALRDNAAVQLFWDRAQATQPDFRLTAQNAPLVVAVCAGLDGLPLALELAAARIGTFSLADMRRQIEREDGGLRLLVSRHRDTHHRHHNINEAIAWSYRLLPPATQRFFARLSLLHGDWTADAAQAVTNAPDALDALETLCQASLVIAAEPTDTLEDLSAPARFRMLELLRQFGAQQLSEEERTDAACRHALFYTKEAQNNAPAAHAPSGAWLVRTQQDLPNLRAALEWCFAPDGDEKLGAKLCLALETFWRRRGHFQEGGQYLRRALAASERDANAAQKAAILQSERDANAAQKAAILQAAARFASLQGEHGEAAALGAECVQIRRQQPDIRALADALHQLGHYLWVETDYTGSEAIHREALKLRERIQDTLGIAHSLNCLGSLAMGRGDVEEARRCWTQNLTLSRAAQDAIGAGGALCNLASLAIDIIDWQGALKLIDAALVEFERAGDVRWTANAHGMAAWAHGSLGSEEQADAHYHASLAALEAIGDQEAIGRLWLAQGRAALYRGDIPEAKRWLRRSVEITLPFAQRPGSANSMASWLHEFASVAYAEGHAAMGVRLQACAQVLSDTLGVRLSPAAQGRQEVQQNHARAALGDAAFTRGLQEGQTLSWQEAIGLALTF